MLVTCTFEKSHPLNLYHEVTNTRTLYIRTTFSVVAYGPKMVKPLHAGPKHQIWYMYSLGQYKHFWRWVPDFEGQGQGQFKVKC